MSSSICGTKGALPCKTIHAAVARAQEGDVINIDGTATSRDPYPCVSDPPESALQINVGVALRSYETRAVIACRSNGLQFHCVGGNCSSVIRVSGIIFLDSTISFHDFSVRMDQCNFIRSFGNAVTVVLERIPKGYVEFVSCTFENNSACVLNIAADVVDLSVRNSSFIRNTPAFARKELLTVSARSAQAQRREFNITLIGVSFLGNHCNGSRCIGISPGLYGKSTLVLTNVTFERNVAKEGILDCNGTSSIHLDSVKFKNNIGRALKLHDGHSVALNVAEGIFQHNDAKKAISFLTKASANGGAICINGFKQEAQVFLYSTRFSNNSAYGSGGAVAITNVSSLLLNVNSCSFVGNEGWGSGGALAVGAPSNDEMESIARILIVGTNFSGNVLNYKYDASIRAAGGGAVALYLSHVLNFSMTSNIFAGNKALKPAESGAMRILIGQLHSDATLLDCAFIQNSGWLLTGTLQFSVITPLPTQQPLVTMQNCTFLENSGGSVYDVSLSQNVLLLASCQFLRNSGGGILLDITNRTTAHVRLKDSVIGNNSNFAFFLYRGAVSEQSFYSLENVNFSNNSCMTKSSIFLVSLHHGGNALLLQRTSFLRNYCNTGVMSVKVLPWKGTMQQPKTKVTIRNSEFHGNSGVTESTLTLLNAKVVRIEGSNFVNNFGNSEGAHLRVQLFFSDLQIYNCTFHQSKKARVFSPKEQPYNGLMTVSNPGNITIRHSRFISDPMDYDPLPLIIVKGAHTVDIDQSVSIQSSIGSRLHFHNFSHPEFEKHGNQFKQDLINTFALSSQTCALGSYTIRRGSAQGLTIKDPVQCISPCPNGAVCAFNLSAKPNFWGYPIGDKVHFTLCPFGYCCPPSNISCLYDNDNYWRSGCQGNRTGLLCGRCKDDFSESLFTSHCIPTKECRHWGLLIVGFSLAMLFALFLVRKPPIFETLWENLTWFVPRTKEENLKDSDRSYGNANGNDESSGYLKIVFYFYQIAGVLTISSYGVTVVLRDNIALPVTSLLDFKIHANNNWQICPIPGITAQLKALSQLVGVATVFLSIGLIYLLHSGLNKLRKRQRILPPCGPYLGAVLETMLLGYCASTATAMKLLQCKQINSQMRWFYDANIKCYTWWQNASVAGIVLYLVPFVVALFLGSWQLYQRELSASKFLLACVFPSAYLVLASLKITVNAIKKHRSHDDQFTAAKPDVYIEKPPWDVEQSSLGNGETSVFEVLAAPFRKPGKLQSHGMIHWESVLVGRRFILILVGTFIEHAFLRSVCLTILCVIVLLHHVSQQPYKEPRANITETISLCTLVVIATLNVGVASYYAAGSGAHNVEKCYVRAFLITEAILLGFAPVLFILFVAVSSASQLVRLVIIAIKGARWLITNREECKCDRLTHDENKPLLLSI